MGAVGLTVNARASSPGFLPELGGLPGKARTLVLSMTSARIIDRAPWLGDGHKPPSIGDQRPPEPSADVASDNCVLSTTSPCCPPFEVSNLERGASHVSPQA